MKKVILSILLGSLALASCKKKGCTDSTALNYNEKAKKDDGSCEYPASSTVFTTYKTEIQQVKETYAKMALASYTDALQTAKALQTACNNFVSNPTDANFTLAKESWKLAREAYGPSEIFRFVEGPIDNSSDGPEGLINAWPMDEAYVDYVEGNPNAGIINNPSTYPNIDVATLVNANESGGEENISTGYHAIEFLLWGQDLSATTAGMRPYTDFVTGGTASNQARRAQYLTLCCDILVDALTQVKNQWEEGANTYRSEWLAMDNQAAIRKMINSIRVMAGMELSGERIYTAYDNMDQEDEHSCFSDNTHRDIALNAAGIRMLYDGNYTGTTSVSGFSFRDLIAKINPSLASEMTDLQAVSKTKIENMYIPFDQAIVLPNERPKVLETVLALQAEEGKILEIAKLFGIKF